MSKRVTVADGLIASLTLPELWNQARARGVRSSDIEGDTGLSRTTISKCLNRGDVARAKTEDKLRKSILARLDGYILIVDCCEDLERESANLEEKVKRLLNLIETLQMRGRADRVADALGQAYIRGMQSGGDGDPVKRLKRFAISLSRTVAAINRLTSRIDQSRLD